MSFGNKIRKLDVFKKIPEDITQATNRGGIVSLLTALTIIAFITVQIYNYLNPQYQSMIMPMRRQFRRKMKINVDIVFPKVPCTLMNIEMQDAVMSSNYEITEIQKISLDQYGNQLQEAKRKIRDENDQYTILEEAKQRLKRKEGCRMVGTFEVNEVPGIFRFVPFANQNVYALLMSQADTQQIQVDFSHQIKLLSFGDSKKHQLIQANHPKALLDPLSNTSQTFKKGYSTYFHYHLDIVPTFYRDRGIIESYQYVWRSNTLQQYFFPVVYFQYQLGGLALEVHRDKEVQSQFIIKLCAVVGGTFTVASFLNNALQWVLNDRRKGYELIG